MVMMMKHACFWYFTFCLAYFTWLDMEGSISQVKSVEFIRIINRRKRGIMFWAKIIISPS